MSSSAREKANVPASISPLTCGETLGDGLGVGGLDDALAREHGDMGQRAGDVLGGELAVEVDRGVDLLHDFGRAGGEPAAPHRVAHEISPWMVRE